MTAKNKETQEAKLSKLVIYRDDDPNPLVPVIDGIAPTIVDLHIPPFNPKDFKKLVRLPEPRRTAKWIQMAFTDDDNYLVDPECLWRVYRATFEPLMREDLEQRSFSHKPLVVSVKFWLILMRAIHGVRPWNTRELTLDVTGKNAIGFQGKVVVRGVRARNQALTFPSTNRESQLHQLRFYKSNDMISKPQSLFAQKLAQDPLFMEPATKSVEPLGSCEGSESIGFPGVNTLKRTDGCARVGTLWACPEEAFEAARKHEFGDANENEGEQKDEEAEQKPRMTSITRLFEDMTLVSARIKDKADGGKAPNILDKGKGKA